MPSNTHVRAAFILAATTILIGFVLSCGNKDAGGKGPVAVTVYAKHQTYLGANVSRGIDNRVVHQIRGRAEVLSAVPRVELMVPANGTLTAKKINGSMAPLKFEVGGFCDGIQPAVVAKLEPALARFARPERTRPRSTCGPNPSNECTSADYCDARDRTCRRRIPVLISPLMLSLYNDNFAGKHGLPQVDPSKFPTGLQFDIQLGATLMVGTRKAPGTLRSVGAVFIGISKHAQPIGLTIPMRYVQRWNAELRAGRRSNHADDYSSVDVLLKSKGSRAAFTKWLEAKHQLFVRDSADR